METEAGKVALYAVERAPEIGGFTMGVVENDGCGVELLREAGGAAHLPHIVHAKIAQPRHVRYLARDAPPRTLEEKTEVHVRGMTLPLMRQCRAPRKHTLTADNRAKINLKIKSTCKKIRRKSVERNHGAVFYARDIRLRHAQSFSNFKLI